MDSMYGDALLGGMGLLGVISAVAYIIPVLALGFVLYYFTGTKKFGEVIMKNFMRVSLKTHNFVWMFVGTITAYSGLNKALTYIFSEILPEAESFSSSLSISDYDYDSLGRSSTPDVVDDKTLVVGLVYLFIGLLVFSLHLGANYMILTKKEQKGTFLTKLFVVAGMITFSVMIFSGLLSLANSLIDYSYDTDLGMDASPFAMFFASLPFVTFYVAKGLYVFKRER